MFLASGSVLLVFGGWTGVDLGTGENCLRRPACRLSIIVQTDQSGSKLGRVVVVAFVLADNVLLHHADIGNAMGVNPDRTRHPLLRQRVGYVAVCEYVV